MAKIVKITVDGFECARCKHQWVPRDIADVPKVCPKCKSPYWENPRLDSIKPKRNRRKAEEATP